MYRDQLYLQEKTEEFRRASRLRPIVAEWRRGLPVLAFAGRRLRLAGEWLEALGTRRAGAVTERR